MWHVFLAGLLALGAGPTLQASAQTGPSSKADTKTPDPQQQSETGESAAQADTPSPDPSEDSASDGNDTKENTAQPGELSDELDQQSGTAWRDVLDDILDSGAIGELRRGGLFMWPILLLGIVAAGVALERWRSLKMVASDTAALRGEVLDLLQADRVEEALAQCDAQQGPVPYVLAVGLRKYLVLRRLGYDPGQVSDQVVRAMDDHSVHIVAALERHLPILATVSSVAPMLGFLGTVQGMVVSFREIVERMGETNIVEAAATGINIALLTTVFGLIVGIPTYIAYNYFTSVINGYVLQVEESATELIETVTLNMALEQAEQGA